MPSASASRAGSQRDPRSIVTPDAFEVSDALLGMPLAAPGRRLAAILVDLVVIGLLTLVTQSFALVLGIIVAVLFVRAGLKRVAVPGSAFGRAMRLSVGCLGVFIGFVTLVLWAAFGFDVSGPRVERMELGGGPGDQGATAVRPSLASAVMGATSGLAFTNAETRAEAEAAARRLVAVGRDLDLGPEEMREVLEELAPAGAPWASEADAVIDGALATLVEADTTAAVVRDSGAAPEAAETAGADGPTGTPSAPDQPGAAVSAPEQLSAPVADSIDRLLASMEALEIEARTAREIARAREGDGEGFLGGIRGFLDELGFGFGWATLYMTVVLTWLKGQTVGKRLLGIRVLRLDGEPITWWTAFERAGGYAAGFATGLLGFAQVYWDANRQAIHDRIVGTVVVREGAPKVIDWESAL